jgi:hypothetical protein
VLSRHQDWRFQPDVADPTGLVDHGLLTVAQGPTTDWLLIDTEHAAANAWIAQTLGLCTPSATDSCANADVRDYYVTDPDDFIAPPIGGEFYRR